MREDTVSTDPWGRVDEDGTVYVRTAEGERAVGSWQAGEPEEALAYYRRKFDELAGQVQLLEQRVRGTDLAAKPRPRRASPSCGSRWPRRTRSAISAPCRTG